MEITIFAKKRTSKEGKPFYTYLSTLTRKDGATQIVNVKFTEDAGNPDTRKCPMNIIFDKKTANIATRTYVREDTGETGTSYTLWIREWEEGSPFVDESMDDYV